MTKPKLLYTALAQRDLDEITDYLTTNASLVTAEHVITQIITTVERLHSAPTWHALRPELGPTVRATQWGPYLIFYSRTDDNTELVIRRILHGRRAITSSEF